MLSIQPAALPPLALRIRLQSPTAPAVGELRFAANKRLAEAEGMLRAGHFHGAAYLAGYAAEIGLGYCWARFTRANPNASAQTIVLPARRRAEHLVSLGCLQLNMASDFRQGHSPLFWWRLYACERLMAGRKVAMASDRRIELLADFLQNAWDVWLRYVPSYAASADAEEIVYRSKLVLRETYELER